MTMRAHLVKTIAAFGMVALSACGGQTEADERFAPDASMVIGDTQQRIEIETRFVRLPMADAVATAGYASLRSAETRALTGAVAEGFGRVELHTVTDDEGMMRMRMVEEIPLPAGEVVDLKPGGYHLMMFEPPAGLEVGDEVPVTFLFGAASITVSIPVAMAGDGMGHDH